MSVTPDEISIKLDLRHHLAHSKMAGSQPAPDVPGLRVRSNPAGMELGHHDRVARLWVEGDKYRETRGGQGDRMQLSHPPPEPPGPAPQPTQSQRGPTFPARYPVIAGVVVVAAVAALVLAAYAVYTYLHPPERTFNNIHVIQVDVTNDSSDTIITLLSVPPGLFPATTYFAIQHDSVTILPRTPVSSLTEANRSETLVLYDDRNPASPEIQVGDIFRVSLAYYSGYWAEISTGGTILLQQKVR